MERGQIVWIEYEIGVKDDDELIETTDAERAAEQGLEPIPGPVAVIVGSEGGTLPGVMEAIEEAAIDDEREIEIAPEDAFGERDPKLIELFTIPKLRRMGVDVEEGATVKVKGREGRIIRLSGSRAWVDFNHARAGQTLRYRFRVVRAAEGPEEMARGIIDVFYRMGDRFDVAISDDEVRLTLPAAAKFDPNWQIAKIAVAREIQERLDVPRVVIVEEYERKTEPEAGEGGGGAETPGDDGTGTAIAPGEETAEGGGTTRGDAGEEAPTNGEDLSVGDGSGDGGDLTTDDAAGDGTADDGPLDASGT